MTRLVTRLHSSSDSSVFLEQILLKGDLILRKITVEPAKDYFYIVLYQRSILGSKAISGIWKQFKNDEMRF